MLNIAIGRGTAAREVGRYRVETAPRTNGEAARTLGMVAGAVGGVVAGIHLMDAHQVTRYRAETAHPTDGEGEADRELTCRKMSAADCGAIDKIGAAGVTEISSLLDAGRVRVSLISNRRALGQESRRAR
jgi:hypothetical protein